MYESIGASVRHATHTATSDQHHISYDGSLAAAAGSQTVLPREVWLYPSRPCEIHGTQHVVWIKQIISKMLRFIHFSPKLLFPRALNRHKTSIQQASTPQHNSNLREFSCQVSHIWGSKGACIQLVEMLLAAIGVPSRPQEPEYGKPPGGPVRWLLRCPAEVIRDRLAGFAAGSGSHPVDPDISAPGAGRTEPPRPAWQGTEMHGCRATLIGRQPKGEAASTLIAKGQMTLSLLGPQAAPFMASTLTER